MSFTQEFVRFYENRHALVDSDRSRFKEVIELHLVRAQQAGDKQAIYALMQLLDEV